MSEILDQPLITINQALRDGETSAQALAMLAIERHAQVGSRLHAYMAWGDEERVLALAQSIDAARQSGASPGPLAGMPVSIKDLYGVEGYPTYAGTARRLPEEWESEGFLVQSLQAQRALVMGKTHTVELAFGGLGNNPHWGTPVNPWDPETDRAPGGSSCGAGVSLWEGSAVIALGSDTAGSIRLPASMTACVGHKITYDRWPVTGVVPLSHTLDTAGALTRSAMDAAYFFAAIDPAHGEPEEFVATFERESPAGLRLGVCDARIWDDNQDDIVECVRRVLGELEASGARIVDFDFPEFNAAFDIYAGGIITAVESRGFVESRLPEWMDLLHDTVGQRLRDARQIPEHEYLDALRARQELMVTAQQRLEQVDVVVTPTVPFTPPPAALFEDYTGFMLKNRGVSLGTNPVNMLGLCAITLPCGLDAAGMPVGLQLIAPNGADEQLLSAAMAVEKVLGTAVERLGRPPLGGVAPDGQASGS